MSVYRHEMEGGRLENFHTRHSVAGNLKLQIQRNLEKGASLPSGDEGEEKRGG